VTARAAWLPRASWLLAVLDDSAAPAPCLAASVTPSTDGTAALSHIRHLPEETRMPAARCYATTPDTRFVALVQNARSTVPEIGLPSMVCFMEVFRPRVARYVAPLHAGLRVPILTRAAFTEHALASLAAQLDACPACTDDALHVWVSSESTRAVLDLHHALRRALRTRRRQRITAPSARAA
jgi:hypothetical protein